MGREGSSLQSSLWQGYFTALRPNSSWTDDYASCDNPVCSTRIGIYKLIPMFRPRASTLLNIIASTEYLRDVAQILTPHRTTFSYGRSGLHKSRQAFGASPTGSKFE